MLLITEHFDLDETVPEPNVDRIQAGARRPIVPIGMPFLFDVANAAVLEPVLMYARYKFNGPNAFSEGRWKKAASAEAAISDLKDWWYKLHSVGVPWDAADDDLVAEWLVDLRMELSGRTNNFLASATVKRRSATISEFYGWALERGLVENAPTMNRTKRLAKIKLTEQRTHKGRPDLPISAKQDPHPLTREKLALLTEAIGPLPSDLAHRWKPDPSIAASLWISSPEERRGLTSRDRIAFELALSSGMRIDEIANLEASIFEGFECDDKEAFHLFEFTITHTKGLRPREVFIPYWLMSEIATYVANERTVALTEAKRIWATGDNAARLPWQLLVNPPGTGRHVGKAATDDTLEAWFNKACAKTLPGKKKSMAKGTARARTETVVAHTFHDLRHTFAVLMYRSLESIGIARPWLRIQTLLGHQNISTTVCTYLKVLDDFGHETLERLAKTFAAMRERHRSDEQVAIH